MAKTLKTNYDKTAEPAERKESAGAVQRSEINRTELLISLQTSLDPVKVLERFLVHISVHFGVAGLKAELPGYAAAPQVLGSNARHHLELRMRQEDGEPVVVTLMRSKPYSGREQTALEEYAGLLHFPLRNALLYQQAVMKGRQDDLTGLYNRAALRDSVEREVSLAQRHREPLSLVMLDVDGFKAINDHHGHQLGDKVLRALAEIMRDCARCSDLLFRYAGDEFLIVASHTDAEGAEQLAERVRQHAAELDLRSKAGRADVRVSVGVAEMAGDDSFERFFERVDQALYAAKRSGRNRVVAAD